MEAQKNTHSKIGASSYYRWKACPGSVKLCEGIESPESPYAKEGTLAHELAADILECFYFKQYERATVPVHTPAEMTDAVRVYVDYVKKEVGRASATPESGDILIEHSFDLGSIYPGLYGTADCVVYHKDIKKLTVIDYKHGAGIAVDVENNLQLQYYGLGALISTGKPCDKVELVIVQPRCEHPEGRIRKWEFSAIELLDFAADLARDAHATEDPKAKLIPGGHCRFCPAAAAKCPAIHDQAKAMAKLEFKPELSYDPQMLAKALAFVPALEAWAKSVREFAYGEALHGRCPPGWKVVEKRALRKWTRPEEDIVNYVTKATKKPAEECYERKLKSPAQMEKLLSKQLGAPLREMMVTESSGYVLAPESDKRPPAKVDPKKEFEMIEPNNE